MTPLIDEGAYRGRAKHCPPACVGEHIVVCGRVHRAFQDTAQISYRELLSVDLLFVERQSFGGSPAVAVRV